MSVQVKRRRDTAVNVAAFTGAAGEIVVDTTNNRMVLQDGATAGGWPAARLSEVQTVARRAVSDANYGAVAADRTIAFTTLTASRVVTLPGASSYPTGTALTIVDESGNCSAANAITVNRAGSDTINGAAFAVLNAAYMSALLVSNGVNKWTLLANDQNEQFAMLGLGTAPDPANPLSVFGASALFNGNSFSLAINKSAPGNTASILFQDGFSARAQMGLNGSDNYSFKVSPDGSAYFTAIALDAATGAPTFGNQRTAVADANYSALTTDREVAYTAITAPRSVSLPAASGFPAGHTLIVIDESGAVSATNTLSVLRAGSDTIAGRTSATIASPFGYLRLICNGSNQWSVAGRSLNLIAVNFAASPFNYTPTAGMTKLDVYLIGGGGGGGGGALQAASTAVSGGGGGGGGVLVRATLGAAQIGAAQTITLGQGGAAGAAATSSSTAGGNGGAGGATTLGSLTTAGAGGGGAGGQLGANSGGGGGAGYFGAGGNATGAAGGSGGSSGGFGGGAGAIGLGGFGGASGGGGGAAGGAAFAGGNAVQAASGGGSGGGISTGNATAAGGAGGIAGVSTAFVASGAGISPALTGRDFDHFVGSGGAGGASSTSAAGGGGAGGAPGGGGGGGGSAQNGGSAGAGGAGGNGFALLVEYF